MKREEVIKRIWNIIADDYNQWHELGQDEKDELIEKISPLLEEKVCEWAPTSYYKDSFYTDCGADKVSIEYEQEYCQYCGGKIKVVLS